MLEGKECEKKNGSLNSEIEKVSELKLRKMRSSNQASVWVTQQPAMLLLLVWSLLCSVLKGGAGAGAVAGIIPPPKLDGFVYESNGPCDLDAILIEAFYDPLCPDSRDSWPPLKQALRYYGSRVSLILHLLPLPYHDNAFVASRALHVVNALNTSTTFPMLEWFFEHQEKFDGARTQYLSRASVEEEIIKSATEVVGSSYYNSIKNGFSDRKTNSLTTISFTYAASRAVYGTPFFYVNGFLLPDSGAAIDYFTWRRVIDPLIVAKNIKIEEPLHSIM